MLPSITWGIQHYQYPVSACGDNKLPVREKRLSRRQRPSSALTSQRKLHFEYALEALRQHGIDFSYSQNSYDTSVRWEDLPQSVSVEGGRIPPQRCWRKRIQVENMVFFAAALISHALATLDESKDQNLTVCEFCAGSGFIALPLAAMFPTVKFILIDAKVSSY